MTLIEIRSKICTLRNEIETLQSSCREIAEDPDSLDANEADDLEMALETIAELLANEEND